MWSSCVYLVSIHFERVNPIQFCLLYIKHVALVCSACRLDTIHSISLYIYLYMLVHIFFNFMAKIVRDVKDGVGVDNFCDMAPSL